MTPISPYESSLTIDQSYQPLAGETQFHTLLPMEKLIPQSPRNATIRNTRKRKSHENEAFTPAKKLKYEYEKVSLAYEELVLPSPLRCSNRPNEVDSAIMPMRPPAPHKRHMQPTTSKGKTAQRILSSIEKRNEYIYSASLSEKVYLNGLIINETIANYGMALSTSRVDQEDDVNHRIGSQNKDKRNEPSPLRTKFRFLPRRLVPPQQLNEHGQKRQRPTPEVISMKGEISHNVEESSSGSSM